MRAGLLIRVAAASGAVTIVSVSAGRGLALLADIPDGECRDGFSQPVVRREYSVIPMPVLPRRWDEIGEPVQELKRREFDQAVRAGPRGLPPTTPPDPVGRLVPREHVADSGCAAVWAANHGEPLKREWRPGTVSQQVFETLKITGHIAVGECDPDARID